MNIRKLNYLPLLLILVSSILIGQERTLKGLVMIDFEDESASGVLIKNQQTQMSVISDLTGYFEIKASIGDTLYFKRSFLQTRKLAVQSSHFDYDPLVVHMNKEIIELDEIVVRPPLTGDLENDIRSVKRQEYIEEVYANLGIDIRVLDMDPKEKVENVLAYIGGIPIPTSLNIGALIKTFSGYYRKMNSQREYEKFDNKLGVVKAYFGNNYFNKVIGIETNDIREYLMYLYGKDPNTYDLYFEQKDFLSIDKLIRDHAQTFKERIKLRNSLIKPISNDTIN